ncbi:hypothetical protein PSU4_60090 [Pseudonocardia sulfidoxydans NBRC 16205]|uniref:Uncharacterized protein n=1 Tax=Pseudonocardia sulfidoxydans NBRC 16205 TaxID=1223511 RepID=A0A511DQF0_9PSEU|nr:hypothetical protein [Pseudonocardia sulfidoxydans]GEL27055.1 hypothetical protein PSU4_60090 [Pseudonocardia sulfidoxydans NBRC 16205]
MNGQNGARTAAGVPTTSMSSVVDGLAHDVEDTEVVAGRSRGRYVAMCGADVAPAALTAPSGRVCRSCAALRCPELTDEPGQRPARAARRAQSRWLMACSAIMRTALGHQAPVWS